MACHIKAMDMVSDVTAVGTAGVPLRKTCTGSARD